MPARRRSPAIAAAAAPGPRLVDIKPMLLEEKPVPVFDFDAPGWVYELKLDGYRLMAEFGEGDVFLKTRGGANATAWFPEVADALRPLDVGRCVVDGEICVLDERGRSDFDKLHARARRRRRVAGADPVVFCVFDLLIEAGSSLMDEPLLERKRRLEKLLTPAPASTLYLGHFKEGQEIFRNAVVPLKLEGLVAKRSDSNYQPGIRSLDWVKLKRKGAVPAQRFDRGASTRLLASGPGPT